MPQKRPFDNLKPQIGQGQPSLNDFGGVGPTIYSITFTGTSGELREFALAFGLACYNGGQAGHASRFLAETECLGQPATAVLIYDVALKTAPKQGPAREVRPQIRRARRVPNGNPPAKMWYPSSDDPDTRILYWGAQTRKANDRLPHTKITLTMDLQTVTLLIESGEQRSVVRRANAAQGLKAEYGWQQGEAVA
jgi:hypothetical protein